MRIAHWDDPDLTWDNPNFIWGNPSYILEPGDEGYVADGTTTPPSKPKTKTKQSRTNMNSDYLPQSYKNFRDWLQLQKDEVTTALATSMSMTTAERDEMMEIADILLAEVSPIVDLMAQVEQRTANFEMVREVQTPRLRAIIKRAKTSPGCTPAIQTLLQWIGESHEFDPDTARPTITVEAQRGRVKIDGRKPGFEAVNIYFRRKGDVEWKLIAVRKRKFPFYDEAPLATAGTPEVREYMAIGVINDEEIGQPSEIKEVVYAG